MEFKIGVDMDLDAYEPIFEGDEEGLVIKGYEIDGQFLLDFDWEPEGRWSFLSDTEVFEEFVVGLLERLTGQAMSCVEREDLSLLRRAAAANGVEIESP